MEKWLIAQAVQINQCAESWMPTDRAGILQAYNSAYSNSISMEALVFLLMFRNGRGASKETIQIATAIQLTGLSARMQEAIHTRIDPYRFESKWGSYQTLNWSFMMHEIAQRGIRNSPWPGQTKSNLNILFGDTILTFLKAQENFISEASDSPIELQTYFEMTSGALMSLGTGASSILKGLNTQDVNLALNNGLIIGLSLAFLNLRGYLLKRSTQLTVLRWAYLFASSIPHDRHDRLAELPLNNWSSSACYEVFDEIGLVNKLGTRAKAMIMELASEEVPQILQKLLLSVGEKS